MSQPGYGEQPPAAPQYQAPQYGAPQYQAPQYQAGQIPEQSMPPAPPTAPPKKKGGALKIVLIVLAVLLVLCVGGIAAVFFFVKDEVEQATNTRVSAPATLAGRPQITDASMAGVVETMEAELNASLPGATSSAAAFYGDVASGDMVMIVAASGLVADPEAELDEALTTSGLITGNATDVDPGPLGGVARCGDGNQQGISLGVCGWADRGSVGMIVIFNSTGAEAATEFVTMRGEIETQG